MILKARINASLKETTTRTCQFYDRVDSLHRLSEPTSLTFRFYRPYAMLRRHHFQKVAGPWRGSTLLKPFLAIAALGILCWIRARTAQHLEASSFTPTAQKVRTHVTLASDIVEHAVTYRQRPLRLLYVQRMGPWSRGKTSARWSSRHSRESHGDRSR